MKTPSIRRRGATSSAAAAGASVARRRDAPGPLARLGERWRRLPTWARYVVYALLLVAAFVVVPSGPVASVMAPGSNWHSLLFYPIGMYVLLAVGLNIVVGYAGLLDLGYVAFFAIGAYAMAILGVDHGWNFWQVLPVAIGLSMIAGLLLGSPTLRLRGDYLAIVTLGFGEIIRVTANNLDDVTGGPRGIAGIPNPPDIGEIAALQYGVVDSRPYYYILVVLIALVIIMSKRLENSRVGRSWAAIREDEDAAELMGVPTLKFKLWSFAVGAAVAGVAGVVYASKIISIVPTNFTFQISVLILAAVVLGGSANVAGVMLGAFLVAWVPERFRNVRIEFLPERFQEFAQYRQLLFGLVLVLIMVFRPEGLLPSRRRAAEMREGQSGLGEFGPQASDVKHQDKEVRG